MPQKESNESNVVASEEMIVISGDIYAALGLSSLKILAKRRVEFLHEALETLKVFQTLLLAQPPEFPDVEDLTRFLEYKHIGDINLFVLNYEKCKVKDAKKISGLLPILKGKKFSNILQLIENKIKLINWELTFEDLSLSIRKENKKPKKVQGHTILDGLQVHYHNRVRRDADEAQMQLTIDSNALREKLAALCLAQEELEKKFLAIETWLNTKPDMMFDKQRELLNQECTELKLVFDTYQDRLHTFNNACLSRAVELPEDVKAKKEKLHWDSIPFSAKKDAIDRDAKLLLDQYEIRRAQEIREALRRRFFGTDEKMSRSIFGRYLDERAKTFSTRDTLSRFVFLFFCCFGYKTEASIRKSYIAQLKVEMDAYVADPKQALKLKSTVCNGIGIFSKRSKRGELSFANQLKKLEVGLR